MPDWKKKINNPGITNTTTFYGDIVNNLVDYLSTIDQGSDTPLGEVAIATATTFKTGKLKLFDSDSSHKVIFSVPNFSEDKTFNLPSISGTSDDLMSRTAPQIVTGKTLDFSSSNTATGIPKSAIPTQIAYEDEDNSFGQHYIDLQTVSVAPLAPPANTRRLFVNTDGKTSVRTSGGSIIDIEAAGIVAEGGFANGGTATFSGNGSTTTFNITHGITPQPDIATVNAANAVTLNASPASFVITSTQIQVTFKTAPVSGTNNVSLLWAAGFVNQAIQGFSPTTVNTLTNKTLSSPIFSGIATGPLTISGSVLSLKHTNSGSRLDLITENSTLNSSVDLSFYHWDTNSTAVRSSAVTSEMVANTPGALSTYLNFWVFKAGAFLNAFRIQHDGNFLFRKTATTAAILSLANITAERWFTFPDSDGTLATLEATQTISGAKTFTAMPIVNKTAQAGVAEAVARWAVSDDAASRVDLVNASNVDGRFVPWLQFLQRQAATDPCLYFYGYAEVAHDTGSVPLLIFSARRLGDTAITARPLYDFRNAASSVFRINAGGDALHLPIAAAGVAEQIAEFRISDVNSYLRINNGSAVDARFLPQITGRQVEDAGLSAFALQARVEVGHDSGTVPVATFDSRTQADSAVATRPLFSFRNAGVDVMKLNAKGDLIHNIIATTGAGELMERWTVSDNATAYFQIQNASATDAVLAPQLTAYNFGAGAANSGLVIRSYVRSTEDSGTAPVLVFDARTDAEASFAVRSPIFRFRNASTTVLDIASSLTVAFHTNLILSASGLTAPRTYTLPDVSGVLTVLTAVQTLTGKTISATDNTITDASTAAGDLFKSNGTKFVRMARGSALQVLRVNSGGTDLEWAAPTGGGGSWDPTAVETLTNKTINVDANTVKHSATNAAGDILYNNGTQFIRLARGTANQVLTVNSGGTDVAWAAPAAGGGNVSTGQANIFGDFDNTFRSGRLRLTNPADTFAYYFVGAAIAAHRNITLPLLTGNDVMVTEAFAQTLTNKTIAAGSNTISGLVDANIGAHTSTKITITAKGQLNSTIPYTDQANAFGAVDQQFKTNRLIVRNPADTFGYLFGSSAIAANRTVTLPLLTANDIFVMEAFAQTLTNKTLNVDANTFKHSTTNAAGDLLVGNGTQFARLARGTANQVLAVNSGGTAVAWADPTGGGGGSPSYDYFVYNNGSMYVAVDSAGTVVSSHATDFGVPMNAAIAALPTTGGIVEMSNGIHLTTTNIITKNYLTLRGAGASTIIKLANGVNSGRHVIITPNVDTMAGTADANGPNVIHDVTLQNFVIDGNKANNPTGGCGIKKYSYGWTIENVSIQNCKSHGIQSEWTDIGGVAEPGGRGMEDFVKTLMVMRCDGKGIYWRGPHDAQFVGCISFGHGLENWHIQSGTGFSGGSTLVQCHTWSGSTVAPSDSLFIDNSFASGSNLILEGAHDSGKAALHLTASAKLVATNVWCFASDIGMLIESDFNSIEGYVSGVESIGCSVQRDHNNLELNIVDMVGTTGYGLVMGASGRAVLYNRVKARTSKINNYHCSWDNASNASNDVQLTMVVDTGETAFNNVGNVNQTTNNIKVYPTGPGTLNLTSANPSLLPYTNVANSFSENQAIRKDTADLLRLTRANNGVVGTGIAFNLGTAGNGVEYAKIYGSAVTSSPQVGKFAIWLPNNSSPVEKFLFEADGSLTQNSLAKLSTSGLSALRTFTFPDATATLLGADTTQTLTSKTLNATNNTITDTSTALGDILASNGTKFVRKARGTALQVLRVNSGATDVEYASLDSERVGKATASGNASTTVFNIAHGLGSNPTYAFATCSSVTNLYTYTTDATNIIVTFATAPASGTNNVVIYWRVVA